MLRNVHRRGCVHGRFGQSPGDEVWPSKSPPHSTASLFWNTICEPAQLETACTTARRRKGQEVIGALAAAQGNPRARLQPLDSRNQNRPGDFVPPAPLGKSLLDELTVRWSHRTIYALLPDTTPQTLCTTTEHHLLSIHIIIPGCMC